MTGAQKALLLLALAFSMGVLFGVLISNFTIVPR